MDLSPGRALDNLEELGHAGTQFLAAVEVVAELVDPVAANGVGGKGVIVG